MTLRSSALSPNLGMGSSLKQKFEQSLFSGKLELSSMSIRTFPKDIDEFNISDIMVVDISRNKFSEIPGELLQCVEAEELNCYHNVLRGIIDLTPLRFLCKLNLSRNQLTSLPVHLFDLPLEELNISNNKVHTIPPEIGNLTTLIDFDLSCNMLSIIPTEFGKLVNLKDLNARNNFITHIPSELTETPLVRLDLSYNRIAIIPPSYRFLKDLNHLDISNNPLVCPPAQYAERGRIHIFKLLEILVRQQEQKGMLEYEQDFRRKKEEERQRLNYANPRNTSRTDSFVNELLASWDPKATASMLEDPFFKKELEKDKIYREKYGISDGYMKHSLQVAQGRSINTISRNQGKEIARHILSDASSDPLASPISSSTSSDKSSPTESKKKSKRDSKSKSSKSDKGSKFSPKSEKSVDSPVPMKTSSPKTTKVTSSRKNEEEEAALAILDDVILDSKKETTLERSKRAVSFSEKKEVIPPAPQTSPPQSDEEESPTVGGFAFTMQREDAKEAQILIQQEFIKTMVARYLNISIKDTDESLKDGVILCQLLNEMRKNAVRIINMPQGEEKLSTIKATKNLTAFQKFTSMYLKGDCCTLAEIQQGELTPIYETLKKLSERFPLQSDA